MTAAVFALRFALELAALAVLAWWGFTLDAGLAVRIVAGIAAPLAAAGVWAAWVAPASRSRLPDPGRFLVESLVWVAGAGALSAVGHPVIGLAFLVAAGLTAWFVRRYPEPVGRPLEPPG
ncbi:MAG TPA: DUF2568 domain-containing protein [Gaiellaceae bacterium]|nr:DUF2568 domain-containing protein [Gaiellaceae bacterium]